jgi:hypothetical protein
MALDPADVAELMGLMRQAVQQGLVQASSNVPQPAGIPGTAVEIDGADVYVEPDDDLDSLLAATLYSPGVAVGDSVLLLQLPPSGAFVVGPQAT